MPLTAQLSATLDISLSVDFLMMYHQSPYRSMTLGVMMVERGFLFPRFCLLLFLYSIPLDCDTYTCSPARPLQQLDNQHLSFLWLNKAVVCICQLAHMDVLIFYVLIEWVWRLFLEAWALVPVTISFTFDNSFLCNQGLKFFSLLLLGPRSSRIGLTCLLRRLSIASNRI